MFGNFGSVSSQFFRGAPAPPSSITVNSISTTSGSDLVTSYTTSGSSQRNQLPVATNVQLTGLKNVGETVNSSWTYFHINNSPQGSTEIDIQSADDSGFTINVQTIAVSTPYIFQIADEDKYVRLGVTPKTSDGTTGTIAYSSVSQVGSGLTQKQIWISFGPAAKSFSGTNWNLAHTDNPDGTYSLNNLVNSTGTVLTGVNINVDLAMSDSNAGSANAGTGPAANFPAGSASGFWYPASGSRGFIIELPSGGLGIGTGEIEILSNTTSGTTNEAILGVNSDSDTLPNVTGSTVDDVSLFESVDMSNDITIRSTDSTGLSPINAMIIYYYE
jgi:hypothetical protein